MPCAPRAAGTTARSRRSDDCQALRSWWGQAWDIPHSVYWPDGGPEGYVRCSSDSIDRGWVPLVLAGPFNPHEHRSRRGDFAAQVRTEP